MVFSCTTENYGVDFHCNLSMYNHQFKSKYSQKSIFTIRSSRLCPSTTKQLQTIGNYKYFNAAYKMTTQVHIDALNSILQSYSNKANIDIKEATLTLEMFFPNFTAEYEVLEFIRDQYPILPRGHPITLKFQKKIVSQYKELSNGNPDTLSNLTPLQKTLNYSKSLAFRNQFSPNKLNRNYIRQLETHLFSSENSTEGSAQYKQNIAQTSGMSTCSVYSGSGVKNLSPSDNTSLCSKKTTKCVNDSLNTYLSSSRWLETFITFEFSAGLCVVRRCRRPEWEVLVIRRLDNQFFEIPKGHVEHGETLQMAAERELREETGLLNEVVIESPILSEVYTVQNEDSVIEKSVHYFVAEIKDLSNHSNHNTGNSFDRCLSNGHFYDIKNSYEHQKNNDFQLAWFGQKESETCEVRWVTLRESETMLWKSNTISFIIGEALRQSR